jgi:hypothetical protein
VGRHKTVVVRTAANREFLRTPGDLIDLPLFRVHAPAVKLIVSFAYQPWHAHWRHAECRCREEFLLYCRRCKTLFEFNSKRRCRDCPALFGPKPRNSGANLKDHVAMADRTQDPYRFDDVQLCRRPDRF